MSQEIYECVAEWLNNTYLPLLQLKIKNRIKIVNLVHVTRMFQPSSYTVVYMDLYAINKDQINNKYYNKKHRCHIIVSYNHIEIEFYRFQTKYDAVKLEFISPYLFKELSSTITKWAKNKLKDID